MNRAVSRARRIDAKRINALLQPAVDVDICITPLLFYDFQSHKKRLTATLLDSTGWRLIQVRSEFRVSCDQFHRDKSKMTRFYQPSSCFENCTLKPEYTPDLGPLGQRELSARRSSDQCAPACAVLTKPMYPALLLLALGAASVDDSSPTRARSLL
jgi:hypothetical protein